MNPTSKSVYELADYFDFIALSQGRGKCQVDMKESVVDSELNFCGTPACHAGWALVYAKESENYSDGEKMINTHLKVCTRLWANSNPEIWGNYFGFTMFVSNKAFNKKDDEILTVNNIAQHWRKVGQRLEALENAGEIDEN